MTKARDLANSINPNSIPSSRLESKSVGEGQIEDGSIDTDLIAQDAVNTSKISEVSAEKVNYSVDAYERTVEQKFKDIISVKDFGATGDGSTDDSDAVQAAFNYANGVFPGFKAAVFFPSGQYLITKQIDCQSVPFYGESCRGSGHKPGQFDASIVLCSYDGINMLNIGESVRNLTFRGVGRNPNTGAIGYLTYQKTIMECGFQSLAYAITARTGATGAVVSHCKFRACGDCFTWNGNAGAGNGSTSGVFSFNMVANCNSFMDARESPKVFGWLIMGNSLESVDYFLRGGFFYCTIQNNWLEVVANIFDENFVPGWVNFCANQRFAGTNGPTDQITAVQLPGTSTAQVGGIHLQGTDIRCANGFGKGYIFGSEGIIPSCAQVGFSQKFDMRVEAVDVNKSQRYQRGGDINFKPGIAGGSVDSQNGSVNPSLDITFDLGRADQRWRNVYGSSDTIITSDEREKQQKREISDRELSAAKKVKRAIRAYKFNEAVKEKGEDARIHFGAYAQDIQKIFEDEGLDPHNYGLFCKTVIEDEFDDDGKLVKKGGTYYGIRYAELLAFVIAAL